MVDQQGVIIAAIISAGASILAACTVAVQGWLLSNKIEKKTSENNVEIANLQAEHARKLKELENENAKALERYKHVVEDDAFSEEKRRQQLEALLLSAETATKAAKEITRTADIGADEQEDLFTTTVEAFRDFSTFFSALKSAQRKGLLRDDSIRAMDLQSRMMKLFFALNPDEGGKPEYEKELSDKFKEVIESFRSFEEHYFRIHEQDDLRRETETGRPHNGVKPSSISI